MVFQRRAGLDLNEREVTNSIHFSVLDFRISSRIRLFRTVRSVDGGYLERSSSLSFINSDASGGEVRYHVRATT